MTKDFEQWRKKRQNLDLQQQPAAQPVSNVPVRPQIQQQIPQQPSNILEQLFGGAAQNLIPFVDLPKLMGRNVPAPQGLPQKLARGVGDIAGMAPTFLLPGGALSKIPQVAKVLESANILKKLAGLSALSGIGGATVGATRPGTPLEQRPIEAVKGFAQTAPLPLLSMIPGGVAGKAIAGAGYFGGSTALQGGSPEDIATNSILGAGFPLAEKFLPKPKVSKTTNLENQSKGLPQTGGVGGVTPAHLQGVETAPIPKVRKGIEDLLRWDVRKDTPEQIKGVVDSLETGKTIKVYRATGVGELTPSTYVSPFKSRAQEYANLTGETRPVKEYTVNVKDLVFDKHSGDLIYSPNQGLKAGEGVTKTAVPPIPSPLKQGGMQLLNNTETNLRSSGESGVAMADKLRAFRRSEGVSSGTYDFGYVDAVKGLTPNEKINVSKSLDGLETPINEKVSLAVNKLRVLNQGIASKAQQLGLEITDSTGRSTPFEPRANYFPHTPNEEGLKLLETPQGIEQMAAEMVKEGKVPTVAEGVSFINKFIKPKSLGFRAPNLRKAREMDLPAQYIEWNPDKVLPFYGQRAASDLSFTSQFGPKGETAQQLIEGIRQSGGDYQYAQRALDYITHGVQSTPAEQAISSVATSLQTVAKLPLAAISNIFQGPVNSTVYKGTFRDMLKDTMAARSQAGYDFALKAGVIEHSLSDISALTESVGNNKWSDFARKTLSDVKFTATERFNRVFAANAGKSLIESESMKLLDNPKNTLARRHLERLGINPDEVIKNGGVSEQQLLEGANEFTRQTQFGSNVESRPLWASTPIGKVFFQFKQFSYGTNNFIVQAVINEARRGNYGPILAALSVPVIPGILVKNTKDLIRGNQPKDQGAIKDALEIYANGIGLGIFYDMLVSATYGQGSLLSFFAGPTAGAASDIAASVAQLNPKRVLKSTLPYLPSALQMTPLKPLAVPTAVALQALTKRLFSSQNSGQ